MEDEMELPDYIGLKLIMQHVDEKAIREFNSVRNARVVSHISGTKAFGNVCKKIDKWKRLKIDRALEFMRNNKECLYTPKCIMGLIGLKPVVPYKEETCTKCGTTSAYRKSIGRTFELELIYNTKIFGLTRVQEYHGNLKSTNYVGFSNKCAPKRGSWHCHKSWCDGLQKYCPLGEPNKNLKFYEK